MSNAEPQTPAEPVETQGLGWMYWAAGTVAVVLAIIGLITFSGNKETAEAQDKATQLTQKFQDAGLRVPEDQSIFTRSLGTDGGAVCDNPASALGKAVLHDTLANGASFVGRRPVIVDRKIITGELLILQTYCPDKAQEYRDEIADKLKFDDTLKD
jgi:hypothetical protein